MNRGSRRSAFGWPLESYGSSARGTNLEWLPPASGACRTLVIAGVHGEEPETTVILSRALRSLDAVPGHAACVPAVNPDGLLLGTRGNARGVDLNRNLPTTNWQAEPVGYRWHVDESQEDPVPIATGAYPGSEPETGCLLDLIGRLQPEMVVALHAPLACIDDPEESDAGRWLSDRTGLPLVTDIGYPTPGSLGSWAIERGMSLITWEFPRLSIEELSRDFVPVLCDLLREESWECS